MRVGALFDPSYLRINDPNQQNYVQKSNDTPEKKPQSKDELTTAQKSMVAKLQSIDTAVRTHEAAHIAAGGSLIKSGASFSYQKGPDNKLYAVGGEVGIDTSQGNNPQETISKMSRVRAAALAPSDPSSTDYQVAASATMLEMQARLELGILQRKELLAQNATQSYKSEQNSNEKFSIYA